MQTHEPVITLYGESIIAEGNKNVFFVSSWVPNNKSVIKIVPLQSLCCIWVCCLGVTCYKGPKTLRFSNK